MVNIANFRFPISSQGTTGKVGILLGLWEKRVFRLRNRLFPILYCKRRNSCVINLPSGHLCNYIARFAEINSPREPSMWFCWTMLHYTDNYRFQQFIRIRAAQQKNAIPLTINSPTLFWVCATFLCWQQILTPVRAGRIKRMVSCCSLNHLAPPPLPIPSPTGQCRCKCLWLILKSPPLSLPHLQNARVRNYCGIVGQRPNLSFIFRKWLFVAKCCEVTIWLRQCCALKRCFMTSHKFWQCIRALWR